MEVVVIVRRNFIPEPQGYTVLVHIGEDRPDLIVVLQIDYKYYFATYDKADKNYYVQLLSSRDIFNSSVSIPIKAILYNFEKQNFEDVRIGHIVLESISSTLNYELLGTGLSSETDSKVWTENLLVKEISGPYQDNKLVDVIDLTQPVYYLATPSDNNAHDSQVLSIKWEYQYNSEESVSFKNSKRSVVIENGVKKCKLECKFHNKEDILDITLFAFYKTKSPKVSLKNPTTYKETLTESKLIWGSKASPEFENKVIQICKELWGDDKKMEMANGLMAVMAVETGRTFKAHRIAGKPLKDPNSLTKDDFYTNDKKSSRAVGLIQFTQVALEQLGDFKKGSGFDKLHEVKLMYARMGEIKQLDKVKQYLAPAKNKIKSPEDIYLQVFAPIGVGKSDSFVLYKQGTPEYQQNKSLDDQGNKNGTIERKELLSRYYKVYNEGKEAMTSEVKNDFNLEDSETTQDEVSLSNTTEDIIFHIFQSGEIQFTINNAKRKTAKYIYYDEENQQHDLGSYTVNKVKKYYAEALYYDKLGKDTQYIYLVDIRNIKNYSSDTKKFQLKINTNRYYIADVVLASLFGAMLENSYSDYVFNGFSNELGQSIGGSTSHKHGINGDLRYLRKDASGGKTDLFKDNEEIGWKGLDVVRQNKFNDALYKFGWKSMLSQYYGETGKKKLLNHCSDDYKKKAHNDHLHLQSYKPTIKEVKK